VSVATIRKNDVVIAIAGVSRGKTGKVLQVQRSKERVLVEGLSLVKKTLQKSQDNPQGGISEKEGPIAVSNVMLYCPQCKRGVRIRRRRDGKKPLRVCARCSHEFDR